MSRYPQPNAVIINFGIDDLPEFSVGPILRVSREQRMDKIVQSVSTKFSQEIAKIIEDSKLPSPSRKKTIRRAPVKNKGKHQKL